MGEQTSSGFFELVHTFDKQRDFVLSRLKGGLLLFQAGGKGVELWREGEREGGRER